MIKFVNNAFVASRFFSPGMIGSFDSTTEAGLISAGDATAFPLVSKPVELLASSAVAVACSTISTDQVLATYTIPAGTLGVNSILQIEPVWSFATSANNKILKVKIGVTTIYSATRTTSTREGPLIVLANRNSLTSQIQPYDSAYLTAGSGTAATYTLDFSIAQTVTICGNRAASEALSLEYYRILHFVGA